MWVGRGGGGGGWGGVGGGGGVGVGVGVGVGENSSYMPEADVADISFFDNWEQSRRSLSLSITMLVLVMAVSEGDRVLNDSAEVPIPQSTRFEIS